jgi:hypothetical protein
MSTNNCTISAVVGRQVIYIAIMHGEQKVKKKKQKMLLPKACFVYTELINVSIINTF